MEGLTVVELYMMDMKTFFPLCAFSGFSIRTLLYPFQLVKTRMQVQKQHSLYSSLPEAFRKIVQTEGVRGLYRGFWINNLTIFSQLWYIGTYEMARNHLFSSTSQKVRSFLAGGFASVVGQTTVLPIDIVSQHLQVYNLRLAKQNLSPETISRSSSDSSNQAKVRATAFTSASNTSAPSSHPNHMSTRDRIRLTRNICRDLYQRGGWRAFYKGYWTSLFTYGPSSALWWLSYDVYSSELDKVLPEDLPRLLVQALAAPMGGATTTVIMTPMDAVRARMQVENTAFVETCSRLWTEERWGILRKGLSARLMQSLIFSTLTIVSYESIKRFSLLQAYQGSVRW